MRIKALILPCLIVATLAACNGDGGNSTGVVTPLRTVVSGTVFAGSAFASGTVNIYDFSSGTKNALLGSGAIAIDGSYQVSVNNIPSAILVDAVGCYNDKAIKWLATDNGQPPSFASSSYVWPGLGVLVCSSSSSSSLSAVVTTSGTKSLIVAVTPFTHAATGLADFEIRNGSAVVNAVNDSNAKLSQFVGVDIIKTLPVEPNGNTVFGNAAFYGALIVGIPSWIYNIATPGAGTFGSGSLNSIAFSDAMKMDLAQDGVFNGIGRDNNQNTINLSVGNTALNSSIYRNGIALYSVFRLRGETEGFAAITTTKIIYASEAQKQAVIGFLPSFVAFNGYTGPLVNSSPVVALNAVQPNIQLSLASGATLTGYPLFTGYVHDNVGVYANYTGKDLAGSTDGSTSNVVVLIDGNYFMAVSPTAYVGDDVYNLSFWMDSILIANGPHTFTLQVKDNLGSISSVSVNVNVLN